MPQKSTSLTQTDSFVGGRIKARRLELGISQEALGEAVGVTFQQVQKYEKGTNRVGSSRLKSIADALGVSPAYFFIGLPEHKPTESGAHSTAYLKKFVSSEDGMALIKAFRKISRSEVRRRIVNLVEILAGPEA